MSTNECGMWSFFSPEFREPEGINLRTEDDLRLEQLHELFFRIFRNVLIADPGKKYHLWHDWWEHDGLHFPARSVRLEKLMDLTVDLNAFVKAMPKDFKVRLGITPDDFQWYLRMGYDPEDGESFLDITGPPDTRSQESLAAEFTAMNLKCIQENASEYYRRIVSQADQ
ncbi:MAG: hypothetical protein NXI24_22755 [bacterium]|nr:hypothetical protein [bacterium]